MVSVQKKQQESVAELVRRYGPNILNRADRDGLLRQCGLKATDVTPQAVARADRVIRQELGASLPCPVRPGRMAEWLSLKKIPTHKRSAEHWARFALLISLEADAPLARLPTLCRLERSRCGLLAKDVGLRPELLTPEVLTLSETLHAERLAENAKKVAISASLSTAGSDNRDALMTQPGNGSLTPVGRSVMDVQESAARSLLSALGKPGDKWSTKRLQLKLNRDLPSLLEGANEVDGEHLTLLKQLTQAVSDKEEIVVVADKVHSANGTKGPKAKGGVSVAKKTAPAKAAKAAKAEKQNVDKLGSRVGSDCNKVNQCLSKKPKSEPDIRKEAGVKSSVEYHLDKLVRLGKLKWAVGEGYSLPAK